MAGGESRCDGSRHRWPERGEVTQTMQAPDESDVASTRRREVTYWIDEKKGLFPLVWWKLLPLIALIGAAAIALMTLIMIPVYERQVINNAKDELTAAGIDPTSFSFDASYRDLDISGTLPDGVTVDDIRAAASRGDGQRDLDLNFRAPSAPVEVEVEAPVAAPVEDPTAPTNVTATVTEDGVVLTGEVPSEAHRALLVAAAASKEGTVDVVDELVVLDLAPETPGATARVLQMARLLGATPEGATGTATITDTDFTSEWTVTSDADAATIQAVVNDAVGAFPAERGESARNVTDITIDAPPVAEEISTLQAEFDELAVQIRENVTFATGSDVLNDTATATLDEVVALMNTYTQPVVEISGHTDDVGNDASNLELSDLRAAAVRQYLIDAGIDADRVQSVGRGETDPISSNETNEGRAENRRVELEALETFVS